MRLDQDPNYLTLVTFLKDVLEKSVAYKKNAKLHSMLRV